MSDALQAQLVSLVITLLGLAVVWLRQEVNQRAAVRAAAAAHQEAEAGRLQAESNGRKAAATSAKVEQLGQDVRATALQVDQQNAATDSRLAGLAQVAEATHTLVNSNMGAQLKLNAVATRRLADLTHDPADVTAAELADRLLQDHQGKQAVVDRKGVEETSKGRRPA